MKRRSLVAAIVLSALWGSPRIASASEPLVPDADGAPTARPTPPPASPGTVIRGSASAGASAASLFGISSTALHLDAGLGVDRGTVSVPVFMSVELGQTARGLSAGEVTIGAGAQAIVGRVRLGGGLDLGYGWIGRASTSSGSHIGVWALDAFALATVDVLDLGNRRALYLGVKPSLGLRWGEAFFAWGHGTDTWRGAALAGARF